jgi:hypothetical protein
MNPRVIKEVIKQLEHLGRYGNVKLQGRKRRKHLMLTAPIMKEELLDYLLSRKDTMENLSRTFQDILQGNVLLVYQLFFLQT